MRHRPGHILFGRFVLQIPVAAALRNLFGTSVHVLRVFMFREQEELMNKIANQYCRRDDR